MLATANGHVIHFRLDQVSVLAGAGKGVVGIKLKPGDTVIGGGVFAGKFTLTLETGGGQNTGDDGPADSADEPGGDGDGVRKAGRRVAGGAAADRAGRLGRGGAGNFPVNELPKAKDVKRNGTHDGLFE